MIHDSCPPVVESSMLLSHLSDNAFSFVVNLSYLLSMCNSVMLMTSCSETCKLCRGYINVLEVTEILPNISFRTRSHKEQVSLLSVDMEPQADVILGMPWLQRNDPGIDWVERLITFHPDEESRRYTVSGVLDWDVRESKPEWLLSAFKDG